MHTQGVFDQLASHNLDSFIHTGKFNQIHLFCIFVDLKSIASHKTIHNRSNHMKSI